MHTLKFRAECLMDIVAFINIVQNTENYFVIKQLGVIEHPFPDAEIEFDTDMHRKQIISLLQECEIDSHVMVETLAVKEDYTGERTY